MQNFTLYCTSRYSKHCMYMMQHQQSSPCATGNRKPTGTGERSVYSDLFSFSTSPRTCFFMLRVLNLPAPSLRASPADKMLQGPGNLFWAVGMAATRWLLCCLITHFQSVHTPPHAARAWVLVHRPPTLIKIPASARHISMCACSRAGFCGFDHW